MKFKNTVLLFFLFISSLSFAKENSFFVGTKISNGNIAIHSKFEFLGSTSEFKNKYLFTGSYVFFGGTIKNINIYSGFGYNLYHIKNLSSDYFDPVLDIFGTNRKRNYQLISIPFNIDYNLNLYKQKLFMIIGVGAEYNLTVNITTKKTNGNNKMNLERIKEYYHPHSAIITSKIGLLYNINKRIDIYSTFDFAYMPTKYLPMKNSVYSSVKQFNYILSGSIGLNIKFGKKIKKDKNNENAKITSYKIQQRFLLNQSQFLCYLLSGCI